MINFDHNMREMLEKEIGPLRPFQQHILVKPEFGTVDIALEDVPCYHEWIKGEGADISVWRAMDGNRVVGATLPLRAWNSSLPVEVIP